MKDKGHPKPPSQAQKGQPAEAPQDAAASSNVSLIAQLTTLAWNLAFPIVGGALLGHYIDNRYGKGLTWTLSLLVLGVMVAFSNLYTLYMEHGHKPSKKDQEVSGRKENQDEMD